MLAFYKRATNVGMNNVMPGYDATWTFNFGQYFGLGYCNASSGSNNKQNCLDAIQSDFVDMVTIAMNNSQATVMFNGKPVILTYTDAGSQYANVTEWNTLLQNVRNIANQDFYVVGTTLDSNFFECFDALAPWVNLGLWNEATGNTTYEQAYNWVTSEHSGLFSNVINYPGRVVFGGVAPGFDDYTQDWGACQPRQIPRDPALLNATFDYLITQNVRGVVLETWDDWTEGTEFEPDVLGGPSLLVLLRQNIGRLFNEPDDPVGDQRLANRWLNYGQHRNCKHSGPIPVTNLTCPNAISK